MPPLLAWQINDYDGQAEIVFAATEDEARDLSDLDQDNLHRLPQFDRFAPGPVPVSAMLADGWWVTCACCEHRVNSYGCDDCADPCNRCELDECLSPDCPDTAGVAPDPVCDDEAWEVYCSAECQDTERVARITRAAGEAACLERCARYVAIMWPGAVIVRNWPDPDCQGQVSLRVPGLAGEVDWREQEGCVHVEHRDLDAWARFALEAKAARLAGVRAGRCDGAI
jgi:hypothetical protein